MRNINRVLNHDLHGSQSVVDVPSPGARSHYDRETVREYNGDEKSNQMSGRSKPPSVRCGIRLSRQTRAGTGLPKCPVLTCTRRDSPFQRHPRLDARRVSARAGGARPGGARSSHCSARSVPFLCHCHDSRHPHLHAAARPVGGGTFLSGAGAPPSAALSLSLLTPGHTG